MKLVEILARELEVWPVEYRYFVQDHDGECKHGFAGTPVFNEYGIWLRDESSMNEVGFRSAEIACDFSDAIVTRPQWQEERDRMNAVEKISKFSQEQDQLQARSKDESQYVEGIKRIQDGAFDAALKELEQKILSMSNEPSYEQQLWDRVAERAFFRAVDLDIETSQGHTTEFIAKFSAMSSANQADAFMAERAKRVGK